METDGEAYVPISIWGDGVPVLWDRSESCDIWSFSLPGHSGDVRQFRFPMVVVPHDLLLPVSQDCILK
eukprot:3547150-Amphidinium_carterae.1